MSWLIAAVYDRFMREAERKRFAPWRRELLAGLSGEVLEIGAGTGANLPHYPPEVRTLRVSEPDRAMRRKLERRLDGEAPSIGELEVVDASAANLPWPAARFDAVVATLVLCSVEELAGALAEIRRVLRPGGRFVFLEHVASRDPAHLAWQRRFEPAWRRVSGNCHLTRDTAAAIREAGFVIERMERDVQRRRFALVRETVRGVARSE